MLNETEKNILRFYFKVKNSKLYNPNKLQHQIRLVVKRLIKKHDIRPKSIEFRVGTIDNDFVYDRHRLCISFKFS